MGYDYQEGYKYFIRGMEFRMSNPSVPLRDPATLPDSMQQITRDAYKMIYQDLTSLEQCQAAGHLYALGINLGRNQAAAAIHKTAEEVSNRAKASNLDWDLGTEWFV